ncbi:MAG: hypothetical protein ACFB21_01045 [Opitutales bacterium]
MNPEPTLTLTIHDRAVNAVHADLFGHFMEIEEHEQGPATAWNPETRAFRKDVADALRLMNIPHMRYPGGSNVEFGPPWTAYIDRPGIPREGIFRFGFHEFFQVCDELGSAPLLVIPICRSLQEKHGTTYEQSLREAAAMMAYFNGRLDQGLPAELNEWVELRARNGASEPFAVKRWQLGNEAFLAFLGPAREAGWSPEKTSQEYVRFIRDHIDAVKAVDPSIEVIVEVQPHMFEGIDLMAAFQEQLAEVTDLVSHHIYQSWQINEIERDGVAVNREDLPYLDYARAIASAPGADAEGLAVLQDDQLALNAFGKPVAITEWNLNAFYKPGREEVIYPKSYLANGLGAAGFLHAFMRAGNEIVMGNQSMLIGDWWDLGCIRISRDDPSRFRFDTRGQVNSLYSRFHGNERLAVDIAHNAFYAQPYALGNLKAKAKVACVDPLVTRRGNTLFLHVINRDFLRPWRLAVDLSALGTRPRSILRHSISGALDAGGEFGPEDWQTQLRHEPVPVKGRNGKYRLEVAAASVSVFEIALR